MKAPNSATSEGVCVNLPQGYRELDKKSSNGLQVGNPHSMTKIRLGGPIYIYEALRLRGRRVS